METDTKQDIAIYYKTSGGDYIGRIPARVVKYGYNDSFVVAMCRNYESISYFLLQRNKDSDFANPEELIVGPISEKQFVEDWQCLGVQLRDVWDE